MLFENKSVAWHLENFGCPAKCKQLSLTSTCGLSMAGTHRVFNNFVNFQSANLAAENSIAVPIWCCQHFDVYKWIFIIMYMYCDVLKIIHKCVSFTCSWLSFIWHLRWCVYYIHCTCMYKWLAPCVIMSNCF